MTAANAFAVLRLLPMTDREKDAEILVLRYQITVLERQLDGAMGAVRRSGSSAARGTASPVAS
ncbi:hypothetical protein [Actinomadura sp. KC06]|uniref:hypothetical protein n=1 Tax=Actinomadura sp. KC06 TaxID=2530369 RepID=UPI001A9D8466|nr:hypothetical protein [Actinomadura sp. KC06]